MSTHDTIQAAGKRVHAALRDWQETIEGRKAADAGPVCTAPEFVDRLRALFARIVDVAIAGRHDGAPAARVAEIVERACNRVLRFVRRHFGLKAARHAMRLMDEFSGGKVTAASAEARP